MTFRQLEYIVEVADQGSISVAARKLMISQPSLSQSIHSVEKELNITLFDRSSVPLLPTPAGAVFLNKAHVILTAMEDLKQSLVQEKNDTRELTVGVSDAGALINRQIFRDFRALYPQIKLILVERDQYQLERMLEAGKLDMIFTMVPYDDPNFTIVPLVEDELLLALPGEHPAVQVILAQNPDLLDENGRQRYFPQIELGECRDVRFVLSGKDRLKFAQLSALRTAFEPVIDFETDSLYASLAIAAHAPYGTVVPMLYATLYDGADRPMFFRSCQKFPTWSFALSMKKDCSLSEAALQYIHLFIRYIAELGLLTGHRSAEELVKRLARRQG